MPIFIIVDRRTTDLRNQAQTNAFFREAEPEYVFLSAAKVGGIYANHTYPAEFIYDNLMIAANVIEASRRSHVKRLLFFGSSCVYPKYAEQPITEDALLGGFLEPTNKPYALAKIAGLGLCEAYNCQYGTDFRSVMPTNVYGPRDNYHPQNSHVMAALLAKFHRAKEERLPEIVLWGSGRPRREFIHSEDLAEGALFVMHVPADKLCTEDRTNEHINVGCGEDISVRELAELIREIVDYGGKITWDTSMPDGTPKKVLDVTRLHNLGWKHRLNLKEGIRMAYEWFKENENRLRVK